MNTALDQMLKKYNAVSTEDKKNAMKEIMQEIVLCGLSRAGFFNKAAFYGGTALRIFYGLDRFSEDLDFSLLSPNPDFNLAAYFPVLQNEVSSYGLKVEIAEKIKTGDSTVKSAFLKGSTREHMLLFYADPQLANRITPNEIVKIKFEIDIDPPVGAGYETRYPLLPAPYEIRLYDLPSLFAGKIHAVICRAWKNRCKGRDLYDYVFYLSRGATVNMTHLRQRLLDSGALAAEAPFDICVLKQLLRERFDAIDYDSAKDDVRSFIRDKRAPDLWSPEFFKQITEALKAD